MKNLYYFLSLFLIFGCNRAAKQIPVPVEQPKSTAEEIAHAHGYENWSKVKQFEFTFGGKVEDPNSGRSWKWNPKTDDVTLIRESDTISYNRTNMDSIAIRSDRAFINDKYWALIPFQLVWDDVTFEEHGKSIAPVSQDSLNKLTIVYPSEGGYTPGDAYDIFYDEDFIIREWNFRRGNAETANLSNTFEGYKDYNGLLLASEHKKDTSSWNLLIRNIKVTLDQ